MFARTRVDREGYACVNEVLYIFRSAVWAIEDVVHSSSTNCGSGGGCNRDGSYVVCM